MEMKLYSIEDACRILKKSRATVYNWTNGGKLQFEDHPEGRMVYLDSSLESNIDIDSSYESINNQDSNNLNYNKSKIDKDQISLRLLDQVESMQEKLLEYAEKVGQTKLLTDNSKYYQDEYFRIKYELESLQESYKKLESELDQLKKENSELLEKLQKPENKKWFEFLKK
jgi:hypothetical protein